jgi:hypothetical protein
VDAPPVQHRSANDVLTDQREGELADGPVGNRAAMGDEAQPVTVPEIEGGVEGLT